MAKGKVAIHVLEEHEKDEIYDLALSICEAFAKSGKCYAHVLAVAGCVAGLASAATDIDGGLEMATITARQWAGFGRERALRERAAGR